MASETLIEPDSLRVLILAGQLGLDDDGWPLTPLLERLETRRVSVQVLCLDRKHEPKMFGRVIERPTLGQSWLRWLSLRQLLGDGRLRRPDLIHVVHDEMSEVALSLADRWGVPYVTSVDDYGAVERGMRISGRWCRSLVATGPELARSLREDLGVPSNLIEVIPPGIFAPVKALRAYESGRIPVIGSAGPSAEASGFHIFFEAARAVLAEDRDAEFVVAVQGEDELDIRRRAQRIGIGDRFTIADFSLIGSRFWSVLDLYCQPSLAPSAGRTLTLAMAHAVPCIASEVAGLRDLIDDGRTGLIVPKGQPLPLAQAILTLLNDRETARDLARSAARAIRDRFNPESEADQLLDLYRKIVSEHA